MSDKQTICPDCLTIYKVSILQLTMAQGMVCCPKCETEFNALSHLVTHHQETPSILDGGLLPSSDSYQNNDIIQFYNKRIENSNLTLETYLNNLDYFNTEPIVNFHPINWDNLNALENGPAKISNLLWIGLNCLLLVLLFFQVFWFNSNHAFIENLGLKFYQMLCSAWICF